MSHVLAALFGMLGGAICVYLALEQQRKRTQIMYAAVEAVHAQRQELQIEASRLKALQIEYDSKVVTYKELQDENALIKSDLRNIAVEVRKQQMDRDLQRQTHTTLDQKGRELALRYLNDNVKWITSLLTPNNFANSKQRLQKVIEWCRTTGFAISADEESELIANLKKEYEMVVRASLEREEQARIKARIREEQMLAREVERELKQLDCEREAIKVALEKALAETRDQHSAEVERLRARLAEAEARSQRAISQAQLTKSGHVYVISNVGSFGEGIFKIGLTRRLEPKDRIRELGDASVPFPFDVHMMISSGDAPALESALHRTLHKCRINKANPRKEFFKTSIGDICRVVTDHHGEVQHIADAEALEYRQSLTMSDEDQDYIEEVYEKADGEAEALEDDA